MSTKKAAAATIGKPSTTASRKSPTNRKSAIPSTAVSQQPAAKKHSATSARAASERTLSPIHIAEVAGEDWQLLSENDSQTLAAIKKSINAPADVVLAAVGWLAREGKLEFTVSGKTLKISLKP